ANEQHRLHWGLSPTEVELVQFAAQGWTNKEIGRRLYWSEIQVKRKMQDVYRKLQVSDRAQAVAAAIRHGLIKWRESRERKERAMSVCPQCGTPNADEVKNCQGCRVNLYWAFQHFEELAALRAAASMAPRPQTPAFLLQTS